MKHIIKLFIISILVSSCTINDNINNQFRIGQIAPTVFWELPSSLVAAGDSVEFTGFYYTSDETKQLSEIQVWYNITEKLETSVWCPSIESTLKFSIATNTTEVAREQQAISTWAHDSNNWDKERIAYVFSNKFPTSSTLKTNEWKNVETWDQDKFVSIFGSDMSTRFKNELYEAAGYKEIKKIIRDNNLKTEEEIISMTDSILDPNSLSWVYSFKAESLPEIRATYDGLEFDKLIFDGSTYGVSYSKTYSLDATLRVKDNSGISGIALSKIIDVQ